MAQLATPVPQALERIRVLAVDSTRMSSQLLAQVLSQNVQFQVTGIEPQAAAVLNAVASERPDVVLMSSALDDSSGFDLIRQVCSTSPATRVVMLMDTSKRPAVIGAFRAGAHGVFSRTESPRLLAKCITSVHQGQVWANSAELKYLLEALTQSEPSPVAEPTADAILSRREQDVVRCVAQGLSNRETASRLGLTEHTVKNYLFRIFDKLGVSSRVEVVLYAFRFRKDLAGPNPPLSDAWDPASKFGAEKQADRSRNLLRVAAKRTPAPLPGSGGRVRV